MSPSSNICCLLPLSIASSFPAISSEVAPSFLHFDFLQVVHSNFSFLFPPPRAIYLFEFFFLCLLHPHFALSASSTFCIIILRFFLPPTFAPYCNLFTFFASACYTLLPRFLALSLLHTHSSLSPPLVRYSPFLSFFATSDFSFSLFYVEMILSLLISFSTTMIIIFFSISFLHRYDYSFIHHSHYHSFNLSFSFHLWPFYYLS